MVSIEELRARLAAIDEKTKKKGKSSLGYAFGPMQEVESKDIPITPAPKFKK